MPIPKDGEVQLFQVVDTDGNPARVSLIAGVYRLAVDALLVGPAGAYAQGDFDSVAVDEANALAMWVRSAVTALDSSQAAGSRNVPVASRAALAAQAYTLQRLLGDSVIRGDDGATYSAIGTRAAVAAQAYTLQRLLTDGVIRGDDGATYSAVATRLTSSLIGVGTGANQALLTNSIGFGVDTTGAAVLRAVEARSISNFDNVANTAIALAVEAVAYGQDAGTGTSRLITADLANAISGRAASAIRGLYGNAIAVGVDSTGAAVLRPVEARNYDAAADVAASLVGLLVNSRISALSEETGNWEMLGSIAPVPSNDRSALYVVEPRESGWQSSQLGRRFIATSQTAGATLTAQAAFVATTPTLMLRQSAGATETEVVRSISVSSFAATPLGIRVVVMLDPDDRFSAGGTSVTPQNPNEGSAAASGITSFLENPTATAADADERIIYNEGFAGGLGAKLVIEFKDEAILSGVGTLLVYVFDSAGATAPTIAYGVEWEEYV